MLVGNKSDLAANRRTPKEMGEAYAQEEGLLFAEASAKDGSGVEDLFMAVGEQSNLALLCFTNIQRANYRLILYRNEQLQVLRESRYKEKRIKLNPLAHVDLARLSTVIA